jgi:uncharacterized OB-fold protein
MATEIGRKLSMIVRLARRGAWYGAWRFSKALAYGLTHRKCRQCGAVKGFSAHSRCSHCHYRNLMKALKVEAPEDARESKA